MDHVSTKTGVLLNLRDLAAYASVKLATNGGGMVCFQVLRPDPERARDKHLFELSCNKLMSLGLVERKYDYHIGYVSTHIGLEDVCDDTDPSEYHYR